ncbi:MAG: Xaa-Pro peptidase family protein [Nitrososphaerota archaeon]
MYLDRIRRLRENMDRLSLDSVMLTFEPNMYYLSGYSAISLERLVALLLFREQETTYLIVPQLEKNRAEENCKLKDVEILAYSDVEDPINVLKGLLSKYRAEKLGLDGNVPFRFVYPIISGGLVSGLSLVDDIMYSLRIIKDAEEVRCLERAAEINNKLMVESIGHVKSGLSEKQLAAFVRTRALELGADEVAFTLIQSGSNSALPHQEPTDRRVGNGEIVLLDIGIRLMGYYSDITRTVVCGKPSQQQQQIFDIVYRAQSAALSIAKEGSKAGDLDKEARQTISESGYREYFIHRTGHGLGLEVHEPPYIKGGNNQELRKGMVFTVEPGIYLPGKFGVRLEDNIIITESGHINLTTLPKSLSIEDYL